MPCRRPLLLLASLVLACSGGAGEDHGDASATASAGETLATTGTSTGASASAGTTDASASGSASASASTSAGTSSSGSASASAGTTAGTTANTTANTTASTTASTTDPTGSGTDGDPPPLGGDACKGYATRYWDCCKAHCGWQGNVNPGTMALESCDKNDAPLGPDMNFPSACDQPQEKSAFTCYSYNPWVVSDTLAYGFAAVPAQGDICGRCYQLEFDGTGHYNAQDPGSVALAGKTMIVQATNIGFDVGGGQFDILTPGGGVGLFDACSYQWGVDKSALGATYGGFMTYCQGQGGDFAQIKQCVLGRCDAVFGDPALAELHAGCQWYVDWYEAADNPNLRYQEVACPPALVAISGIDRGPLNDVGVCMGGGGVCTQEMMDQCDCGWTNGGTNCGQDDGSCCWTACCG